MKSDMNVDYRVKIDYVRKINADKYLLSAFFFKSEYTKVIQFIENLPVSEIHGEQIKVT